MAKHCQECGGLINSSKCPTCGWKEKSQRKAQAGSAPGGGSRTCEWKTGGRPCGEPGAYSHNIRGGGPWYCWQHFSGIGRPKAKGPEQVKFDEVLTEE